MGGKVKNENYIVIQGFMINELKLKNNELLVYAIIYGFSQNEGQVFSGSLQYLADWTNSTRNGVSKNLKSLVDKGLLGKNEKFINGVKFCEYYVTKLEGVYNKVTQGVQQSCTGGVQQSCTNNTNINNNSNNINNTIDKKVAYGEYKNVKLSEKEYSKLVEEYNKDITDKAITYLDEYIEMKGSKYKSHYLVIRKWVIDAVTKPKQTGYKNAKTEIKPDWLNKEIKRTPEEELTEEDRIKIQKMEEMLGRKYGPDASK